MTHMNKTQLNERADRLREINEIIKELDPEIRAPAFELLQDYVGASALPERSGDGAATLGVGDAQERETFFSRFDTDKPADNALLLAGYYYSQYGANPFGAEEIKTLAREVGLIVPERIDMTFRNARREGKAIFQATGRGSFRPTVHGEVLFKTTYNVTPGRRQKPQLPDAEQQ